MKHPICSSKFSALFFHSRKDLATWINKSGRLALIIAVVLSLGMSLTCRSQTIPESFTPGWVRLDTALTPVCGTQYTHWIKFRFPTVLTAAGDTVLGSIKAAFEVYQDGKLYSSISSYQFDGRKELESGFAFIYGGVGNSTFLAGYDFRITTTLILPGYPTTTAEFGTPGSGIYPGLNNDHFYACNTYFSKSSGDLHNVDNWGKNADGSGPQPTGFDSINTYRLANRGLTYTMTGDWNLGGLLQIPVNSQLQINGFTLTVDTMGRDARGTISGSPTSNFIFKSNRRTVHQLSITPGAGDLNNFSVILPAGSHLALNNPISVHGVLTIADRINFVTVFPEHLTLKSSADRTARIAPFGAGGAGFMGQMIIERYIPARRAWRFLAAPVMPSGQFNINNSWQEGAITSAINPNPRPGFGTHITGGPAILGFDHNPFTAAPSIKRYNNVTQNWDPLPNTNQQLIGNGPYFLFVRGDRGIPLGLNNVPATSTVLRTKGVPNTGNQTFTVLKDGFTAISNPYPSPINFATITRTNVQNNFYVWDPKMGGENGVGAYVLVSFNGTGYDVMPASVSPESQYIQSGQAFFVQSTGVSSGSITIKESDKVSTPATDVFRMATGPGSDRSPFDVKLSTTTQALRISLQSLGTDNQPALLDEVLSSYNKNFSDKINQFDPEKMENIEENMAIMKDGHQLMAERSAALDKDDFIQLKTWNMKHEKQYQLEFTAVNPGTKITTAYLTDHYLNTTTLIDLTKISTVQFSIDGNALSSNNSRFSIRFKEAPVLLVDKAGISAYPNPIMGKTIKLAFTDQPKGMYKLRLINSVGQLISTTSINHNGITNTEQFELKKKPALGMYYLQLANGTIEKSVQLIIK